MLTAIATMSASLLLPAQVEMGPPVQEVSGPRSPQEIVNTRMFCFLADINVDWAIPTGSRGPLSAATAEIGSVAGDSILEAGECASCGPPLATDVDYDSTLNLFLEDCPWYVQSDFTGCLDNCEGSQIASHARALLKPLPDCSEWEGQNWVHGESSVLDQDIFDMECGYLDSCIVQDLAEVSSASHVQWVFVDEPSSQVGVLADISIHIDVGWYFNILCGSRSGGGAQEYAPAVFLRMDAMAYDSSDSLIGQDTQQGMACTIDGLSLDQYGVFDDSSLTRVDDTDEISLDGDVSATFSLPAGAKRVKFVVSSVYISTASPDFDSSGDVCWDDRENLRNAYGSSLGDITYDIRYDLNRDGEIDSDDLGILNQTECSADFNCDGAVDYFDYQGFMNAYSVHSDTANINYDAYWDFYDVQMFLNAYSIGCP